MGEEWRQIGGDVTASVYGATFGKVERNHWNETTSVSVVEIINMLDATGDDSCADKQYYVETSYCDVDDVELPHMREIIRSMGLESHRLSLPEEYPPTVREHVEVLRGCMADFIRMIEWRGILTPAQAAQYAETEQELDTLRVWFTTDATRRAEAMHSYGGYESDSYQEKNYKTLARAMQSEGIPREALLRPSEYDEVPDGVDVGDGSKLELYWHGGRDWTDHDGNEWIEYDMRGYLDMYDDGDSNCTGCGERIESHCWHSPDDASVQYCQDCVTWKYKSRD